MARNSASRMNIPQLISKDCFLSKFKVQIQNIIIEHFIFYFHVCMKPKSNNPIREYNIYFIRMNYFIWNRQKKRFFPAYGAAVKLHFIVPRRAAEKPPERGSAPALGGGGRGLSPNLPPGHSPLDHLPPFRQRQVCYDNSILYTKEEKSNFVDEYWKQRNP